MLDSTPISWRIVGEAKLMYLTVVNTIGYLRDSDNDRNIDNKIRIIYFLKPDSKINHSWHSI